MNKDRSSAKNAAIVGVFAAIAYLTVLICKIIPNVASFLSFDAKDAVILIAGYIFGPVSAVLISVITSLLEFLTFSHSGIYGLIMNIISTVSFCIPAILVYKKKKNWNFAVIGLLVGIAVMTASMLLWNYLITPFYMGVSREAVGGMLASVFLPFNLVKGGLNAAISLVLYKPIVSALRSSGLIAKKTGYEKEKFNIKLFISEIFIFIVFIIMLIILINKL